MGWTTENFELEREDWLVLMRDNHRYMSCPKVLEDAIERLYMAFSGYQLPEDTMPCGCCHPPGANELLHAEPLRKLEWKHLSGYADEALLVWGDLDCFKHLLPRIFDLVLNAGVWRTSPAPEQVFKRFHYGEWRTWPQEEQQAVEDMLYAIWETVRSNPPIEGGYIEVDQWLCSISQCEDDLSSYLNQWMSDERLSASWALSSLILGSTIAYTGTDHSAPVWDNNEDHDLMLAKVQGWFKLPQRGPFWKDCDRQYAQLQEWVRSPATLEKLRRAEISCGNSVMEREFVNAQRCIQEARSTKWEPVYRDRLFQTAYWESPNYRLY
jgi:hypothetical protein